MNEFSNIRIVGSFCGVDTNLTGIKWELDRIRIDILDTIEGICQFVTPEGTLFKTSSNWKTFSRLQKQGTNVCWEIQFLSEMREL